MDTSIPTVDAIDAMTTQQFKIYENRLRRAARRQGLRLEKSRMRDPRGAAYGTYQLVDTRTNTVECYGTPDGYGLTIVEIAQQLNTPQ